MKIKMIIDENKCLITAFPTQELIMEKLVLLYNKKYNMYWSSNDSCIPNLAGFLTDDVGCKGSTENWKEFFNDPKATWTGSNYSDWEKDGNNLSLGFSGDIKETEPRWETTTDQMNSILDCWKEVCEKKPKRFTIIRDGDKVTCTMEME